MRAFISVALGAILCACAADHHEIGREPHLSPVGSGLRPNMIPVAHTEPPRFSYRLDNSLWSDTGADLFRDPRARRIGDVVTVKIAIKDKASLDNKTNRSRNASKSLGLFGSYGFDKTSRTYDWEAELEAELDSKTASKGEGKISRSESIQLRVAAVVSSILPNGNLVISGSQEVRVNHELRVLTVAGVIRPRDIEPDNTISYDKIAEARISYGGRGRLMEVQQPPLGQQVLDMIIPF